MVQPDNVTLFSAKEKWAIKTQKDIEESQMHITKWKKWLWKYYTLYDTLEKQNCGGNKRISVCQVSWEEGEVSNWNTKDY